MAVRTSIDTWSWRTEFFWGFGWRRLYVSFDKLAIIVSQKSEPAFDRTWIIPWRCVRHVEMRYPTGTDGDQNKAVLQMQIDRLDGDGKLSSTALVKVRWRDVLAMSDKQAFLDTLRLMAPLASGDCIFP